MPQRLEQHGRSPTIDLLEIIDQIETAVLGGRRSRLGGGWNVDRDELLDLIDRLRMATPASSEQARRLLGEREELLQQAQEEAAIIIRQARTDADALTAAHEVSIAAQARADDTLDRARRESEAMRERAVQESAAMRGEATTAAMEQALAADRYSLEMLRRLNEQLRSMQNSVGGAVVELENKLSQTEESYAVDERAAAAERALAGQ